MKIRNRQQFLLILTFVAVGLFVGDKVVFQPTLKWWSARSKTVKELRTRVAEGKTLVQRETSIRNRWDSMRTNTLPENASQAEQQVLKGFDTWSRLSGAEVTDIMPQWKSAEDAYSTLNCRVEVNGNMTSLGRFLYELENDPMGLKLETVEISTRDTSGQKLALGLQVSGLVLHSEVTRQ
jgi:Tfp pilus assembly protein PilO